MFNILEMKGLNMNEPSGHQKAKDMADKLRGEKVAEAQKDNSLVRRSVDLVRADSDLSKLYSDNANLGSENLAQSLPMLKIHYSNQSKNQLEDGSEPNNGWFFHTQTKKQYKELNVHILAISKGYKSRDLQDQKDVYTQLLSGVIIDDNIPFLMYVKGMSLSPMWDFGKEIRPLIHNKNLPAPMFSLTVKLTTHQKSSKVGNKVWVMGFELVREDDYPVLVTDPGKFVFLRDMVTQVTETMDSIINNKTVVADPIISDEDIDQIFQA